MDRRKLVWVIVVTLLLAAAALLFVSLLKPFLNAQKDRDWQKDRLEGQRHYVKGHYELAKISYDSALKSLDSSSKDLEKLAITLTELGRIEFLLNHLDQSEKDFSEAQSIYTRLLSTNPPFETESKALLQEGLIRSASGLARVHRDQGHTDLAKQDYERLFPMYVQWWQSQPIGEVENDAFHSPGKHKPKQPQTITKANPVLCSQMATDLTDLASIYLNDANFNAARKVSYYLADLSSRAPINTSLKAKANLVYHRAFNLNESEPGIADQF